MITVDRALTLYTDQITSENNIDTNELVKRLNPNDIKEFLESAEAVRILYTFRQTKTFNDFFAKLDEYKNDLYHYSTAVDFRGKNGDEVKNQVDQIFYEEFGDE